LTRVKLPAGSRPKAAFISLPGDVSEASIIALAATLIKGSDVLLEGVLLNAGRTGFFRALRRMGADIEVAQRRDRGGETVGTLRVRSSGLFGRRFDAETLSDSRDEGFLLLLAAAFAEGESVFRDLEFLRETKMDCLKHFIATLKQAGVEIGEFEDGLVIRGREEYDGGSYDGLGHPGLAAAYAVLALKSHGASTLKGAEILEYRFPGLFSRLGQLTAAEKSA
jgi:3-phosphoshikimate 1-carboxyvinyltransferase